jgi:BMFP domain-containing protein YqiC
MSKEALENLAKSLVDNIPEGLRSVRGDLEKNFKSILQGGLAKMDLVTREEFAVQEAVLARTREKLEALEERLAEFESD